jgi:tetratricopeptide (TPR) repeat protein
MRQDHEIADEKYCEAIFSLGNIFFSQGKYDKALIIFDGLMALNPQHKKAAILYGETLLKYGQIDKAHAHFLLLVKKFDRDCQARLCLARTCILLNKYDDAKIFLYPILTKKLVAKTHIMMAAKLIARELKGEVV